MGLDRISELAVAIRMACVHPRLTGGAAVIPPLVRFRTEAKGGAVLQLAGGDGDAVASELMERVQASGRWPTCLGVRDLGYFTIEPLSAATPARRVEGVIAVITGSAQGFGLGIAEALLSEGARVVVADINADLGRACVEAFEARFGRGCALFQMTNVTESASLDACMRAAVHTFGGVDLLISNAGVLKAGGIEELDEAAFDLVTNVNYKGFFLSVKAVTPILRWQHARHPRHAMDIIQINSKSGLEGSNRNFAYAGSKFGGIGLMESFALELVGENVKVNAICPGNYFDGPLWSDPERGLFVQYLRAGKVAGAKTLEDVRRYYQSKVPMGRGCTPEDVAKAIFYLRDQMYETGQALPVTGGQVMLK